MSGNDKDNSDSSIPTKSVFSIPSGAARGNQPGIQAVHVNAAREMVRLHTQSRQPPTRQPNVTASSSVTATTINASAPLPPTSSSFPRVNHPHVSVPEGCKNPQCAHCGKVIIPAPQSSFPIQDVPAIIVKNWKIYTIKKPILNAVELQDLESRYSFPLPEMIFGNSRVRIVNEVTGESIEFNALDALDSLDSESHLKVSYHKEWLDSRRSEGESREERGEIESRDLREFTDKKLDTVTPYDWTYSPNYKGTISETVKFSPTTDEIPIHRLTQPDPILFFDEAVLFEDELADNGISVLSYKIRVMPTCLLLLCRFFLRIDNVIFRIRDVRIFVDFNQDLIIRDYRQQEMEYSALLKTIQRKSIGNDPKKLFRDHDWVSKNIPIVSKVVESTEHN
ncbi:Type 2A phosphatase activator TIP41 [Spathaspora sp. JA1]|nr:Type 2A phosphatase activator TIP41 [Spathaspora sp. JA1]